MEQSYEKWARSTGRQPNAVSRPSSLSTRVEKIATEVDSMPWLWTALGSFAISAGISALKSKKGIGQLIKFVGPALLLYGLYHQIVKERPALDRDDLH